MTMAHLLETDHISKYYGNVVALNDISTYVDAGEVTCILGDNGAGKSSFIKILSGVHRQDDGRLLVDGEPVEFASPRDARAKGIATVYQDLAMVPLMSIWRNFFLGAEPRKGYGPFQWFDAAKAKSVVRRELSEMGIDIRDAETAALQEPVDAVEGAIVELSVEPLEGSVELLGRNRHRSGCGADEVLHFNSFGSRPYPPRVSHRAVL